MEIVTKPTIQEQFKAYHATHPNVYQLFLKYAYQLKAAGCTQYSSDAILHRIRWHHAVYDNNHNEFKINNNFSSRYARMAIDDFPSEFTGFFKVRVLLTD